MMSDDTLKMCSNAIQKIIPKTFGFIIVTYDPETGDFCNVTNMCGPDIPDVIHEIAEAMTNEDSEGS